MPSNKTITRTLCYCVDVADRVATLDAINQMEADGWRVRQLMPLLEGQGGALVACTTQILVVFEQEA